MGEITALLLRKQNLYVFIWFINGFVCKMLDEMDCKINNGSHEIKHPPREKNTLRCNLMGKS